MNENDKIATLESRISNLNSICIEYERLLSSDKNYILEGIAKILCQYDNKEYLDNIKEWGRFNYDNKILFDIVDDINDKFNGFTNIYHDVYEDDNNINLTNERG